MSIDPELSCPPTRTKLSAHPDFFMSAGSVRSPVRPTSRANYDRKRAEGKKRSAWPDAAATSCSPCSATKPATGIPNPFPPQQRLDNHIGTPPPAPNPIATPVQSVHSPHKPEAPTPEGKHSPHLSPQHLHSPSYMSTCSSRAGETRTTVLSSTNLCNTKPAA
jgi:hypothetical protein